MTATFRDTRVPERIWEKAAEVPTGCWEWTGNLTKGYGSTWYVDREWYAHRLMWSLLVGPIPPGLEIDHLCRNTRCCNPDHLEPVTPAENRRRAIAARPRQERCKNGHERTPENLNSSLNCLKCRREYEAAWRKRKRSADHREDESA